MNRHPYLRAYMAGVLGPTWFLLIVMFVLTTGAAYETDYPLERIVVFPMAAVPNLWGLWNALYFAGGLQRRIPLGLWGVGLPLILVPGGFALAGYLGLSFITPLQALAVLPVVSGIYFLVWKHLVGFLNGIVGLEAKR
jgi:hypothetical protein